MLKNECGGEYFGFWRILKRSMELSFIPYLVSSNDSPVDFQRTD